MEQTKRVIKTKGLYIRGSAHGYKSYGLALTRNELEASGIDFDRAKEYDLLVDARPGLITIKILNDPAKDKRRI